MVGSVSVSLGAPRACPLHPLLVLSGQSVISSLSLSGRLAQTPRPPLGSGLRVPVRAIGVASGTCCRSWCSACHPSLQDSGS